MVAGGGGIKMTANKNTLAPVGFCVKSCKSESLPRLFTTFFCDLPVMKKIPAAYQPEIGETVTFPQDMWQKNTHMQCRHQPCKKTNHSHLCIET